MIHEENIASGEEVDNYVRSVLSKEKPLPPITWRNLHKNLQVISCLALGLPPALALYGMATTPLQWRTFLWAFAYAWITGLGITAGYHRLWAHRSYRASKPLEFALMLMGSGAVEGSIHWWSRGHRAHHRYTDTALDPYTVKDGFLHAHLLWMLLKPRRRPGKADVSDLRANNVIQFQHRFYIPLLLTMGFVVPTLVAGLGWGDFRGGFFYAAIARLVFVHHSTFCVNSLAHYLGDRPFDDKHSPRGHIFTALVTAGEGYHNFHHEFPSDYRNAIKWYQYDPTKVFIYVCSLLGLASDLKTFPENEIRRGQFAMELKRIQSLSNDIEWPKQSNELPVITWDEFEAASKTRALIVIAGFVHDVTNFMDEHPGGRGYIKSKIGKDATTAFFGGVYDHSNAANNMLSRLRVACIEGGLEVEALKKYSEVIDSIQKYGSYGTEMKVNDLQVRRAKVVPIEKHGDNVSVF